MKLIWELFFTFLKIGTFTFGGGIAMLPAMRRIAVEEKGWLTEEEMVDCLALSQSLPGMLAVNVAVYIGNKKKNLMGSVFAVLGVVLPALISILVILLFLGRIEDNPYVQGGFEGIKAASVALILVAAYKMARQTVKSKLEGMIAAISFAIIVFAGINAIWAVVFGGLAGLAVYLYRRKKGGCV